MNSERSEMLQLRENRSHRKSLPEPEAPTAPDDREMGPQTAEWTRRRWTDFWRTRWGRRRKRQRTRTTGTEIMLQLRAAGAYLCQLSQAEKATTTGSKCRPRREHDHSFHEDLQFHARGKFCTDRTHNDNDTYHHTTQPYTNTTTIPI